MEVILPLLVVKYRRQVINDEIANYAYATFGRMLESYHTAFVMWNHDKNHVHVMFKDQFKIGVTKFINPYKSVSSCLIK